MNKYIDRIKRNIITIKLYLYRSGWKKAKYLRKKKIFKAIGDHCYYHTNLLPAEPFLVSLGNNVVIAANVRFITHSAQHIVFNQEEKTERYKTMFGEIIVGNNVFIGANATIMYNVKIGNNVIVAAGAIVTHDIPNGSVVAGVPAKIISSYDDVKKKNLIFSEQFKDCKSNIVHELYDYKNKL